MAADNIEQLFCKEYESLKAENKNLSNHNQQLKDEVSSIKQEVKELLSSLPTSEEFYKSLPAESLAKICCYSVRNSVYDNEIIQLIRAVIVQKKGDK